MEQEEYTKEEIDWSYIDFVDNKDVLDLIEKVYFSPTSAPSFTGYLVCSIVTTVNPGLTFCFYIRYIAN